MNPDNFENHNVFDRLNAIEEILSNDEIKEKIDLQKLSFFDTVLSFITRRMKLTIPDLVQLAEMDVISKELNAAVSQINAFIGNNNDGHLNNAVNHFNTAINRTKNLPVSTSENDFDFSHKIANFEKIAANKYKSLGKEKDKLKTEIDKITNDLSTKESEIQKLISLIDGKEAEIENLSSSFQTTFDNIKLQHDQQFSTALKSYSADIKKSKEQFRKEIDELKNNIDTNTSQLVTELETKHNEAKKLVNLIGNVGITGNYQNIANNHKKDANRWRWVAVAFMAAFSIILLVTIWNLNIDSLAWQQTLVRVIAAISLSYPATYAARESSKHRKLETINRNAELELASINPFIEDLELETKQKIKGELVERYFGNNNNFEHSDAKDLKALSIENLDKLVELISKIKKP